MFGGGEVKQGLELFRITVLGSTNSGKTSLISSFVNNFCPTVYTPTGILDSLLYYKTMDLVEVRCLQIQGEQHQLVEDKEWYQDTEVCMICGRALKRDDKLWRCRQKQSCGTMCSKCWLEQHEEQAFPVLVEIEDSYGSKTINFDKYEALFLATEGRKRSKQKGSVTESLGTPASDSSTRVLMTDFVRQPSGGLTSPRKDFDEVNSSPLIQDFNAQDDSEPSAQVLRRFDPPVVGIHHPLAKRRMGYLVVYDCQDDQSFEEAFKIIDRMVELGTGVKKQPVVFLVANKQDIASGNRHESLRTEAKQRLERYKREGDPNQIFRFEEVSATELKKVKGLFRRLLLSLKDTPALWASGKRGATNTFSSMMFGDQADGQRSGRSGEASSTTRSSQSGMAQDDSSSEDDQDMLKQADKKCEVQ